MGLEWVLASEKLGSFGFFWVRFGFVLLFFSFIICPSFSEEVFSDTRLRPSSKHSCIVILRVFESWPLTQQPAKETAKKTVPPLMHKPARSVRKSVRKILGIDVNACGKER